MGSCFSLLLPVSISYNYPSAMFTRERRQAREAGGPCYGEKQNKEGLASRTMAPMPWLIFNTELWLSVSLNILTHLMGIYPPPPIIIIIIIISLLVEDSGPGSRITRRLRVAHFVALHIFLHIVNIIIVAVDYHHSPPHQ